MYEVLIIGAGPAGNVAALELAKHGVRTAVIDYRENIGDKLCTGGIGVECARRFPVSPRHIRREVRSALIHSPSGQCYRVERREPQALIVDRVGYVSEIANNAVAHGAQYHIGYRATAVDRTRRGITVSTRRGMSVERFEGRLLFVAAGFRSPVTRMVGLCDRTGQDYVFGQQVVVETKGVEGVEVFVGGGKSPESVGWVVPISPSQGLVGTISRQKRPVCLDSLVDRLRQDDRIEGGIHEFSRWGIPVRPLTTTFATRLMVLGDSAGLTKPTTGGGIYYGMLSGQLAAETALEALDSGDLSVRSFRKYEQRWKREFGRELEVGYYARKLYESMSDAQKEDLLHVLLSDEVQSEILDAPGFSFDWHSRTILGAIGNRRIARLISGFGPAIAPLVMRMVRSAATS